ncbi:LPXTG-domain-containing protein [Streptococcus urinalis FB127-CNA-2]|nr:LPXTG cell wall anchor domain-containing protein [Streptococcus urinalis]EKS18275.1 LPXTG-domain-containing protein [Streptococcus urinalis FB127-CNA-2]VEF32851.1 Gram positive anchor [Streptococcus urinalis]
MPLSQNRIKDRKVEGKDLSHQLPSTGENDNNSAFLTIAALSLLSGIGLALPGKRKKERKNLKSFLSLIDYIILILKFFLFHNSLKSQVLFLAFYVFQNFSIQISTQKALTKVRAFLSD